MVIFPKNIPVNYHGNSQYIKIYYTKIQTSLNKNRKYSYICIYIFIQNIFFMGFKRWIPGIAILLIFSGLHAQKKEAENIKWYTIEEAVKLTREEPRKIFIDVYTDWCGWCKVMDKNTFNNGIISSYMNKNFYPVKFNAGQKNDIVINGQTYKFISQGSRGYHELAAALLNGKLSYPSVVFLNEDLKIIQPFNGYIKPMQFDQIMKFIGGNHYKTQTWEVFLSGYESPISREEGNQ